MFRALAQLTYPLDVLRRRMQVAGLKSMGFAYNTTWEAIVHLVKTEGIRGLYKGERRASDSMCCTLTTSLVHRPDTEPAQGRTVHRNVFRRVREEQGDARDIWRDEKGYKNGLMR